MTITNLMMKRGPARFTMSGQKLPYNLVDLDQAISPGLVARLARYAMKELTEVGFAVSGWDCEVYTMDGDEPARYRYYTVEFTNSKGGKLGVQGIGIGRGGHPELDHGLHISR